MQYKSSTAFFYTLPYSMFSIQFKSIQYVQKLIKEIVAQR